MCSNESIEKEKPMHTVIKMNHEDYPKDNCRSGFKTLVINPKDKKENKNESK